MSYRDSAICNIERRGYASVMNEYPDLSAAIHRLKAFRASWNVDEASHLTVNDLDANIVQAEFDLIT